jgi:hypothetical protein
VAEHKSQQSGWDRTIQVLQISVMPVVVSLVGYFGSSYLAQREQATAGANFYAELLTKREESDSNLRKEMFRSVIDTFLGKFDQDLEKQVLGLELLAYNFNDSLDLGPLFKEVYAKIEQSRIEAKVKQRLVGRLVNVTTEINAKQSAALAEAGAKWDTELQLTSQLIGAGKGSVTVIDDVALPLRRGLPPGGAAKQRYLRLEVVKADVARRQLLVHLQVRSQEEGNVHDSSFWVGYFDFPMLDNTRLPDGQRCAVVMNHFSADSVQLTLVYFPGSRASLKEKPYYDELIEDLMYRRNLQPNDKSRA